MNNIGVIMVKMVMKWLNFTRYAANNEKIYFMWLWWSCKDLKKVKIACFTNKIVHFYSVGSVCE